MQQFIDNLISRLEERKKEWTAKGIEFSFAGGTTIVDEMAFGTGSGLYEAIEIVNQLAEEYKSRTNADKIRSMTDEELAEVIFSCPITESCPHWNKEVQCQQCIREWLKSEAKE